MNFTVKLFSALACFFVVVTGCTQQGSNTFTPDQGAGIEMILGQERMIPVAFYDKAGGSYSDGELHNMIVEEYINTYGGDKEVVDYSTLASRMEGIAAQYAAVPASSFADLLEFIDPEQYNGNSTIYENYTFTQMGLAERTYWQGMFDTIEGLETGEEIETAVIAYGEVHGFPINEPYSGAFDVLLHSNEYWETFSVDFSLRRGSHVIAADAAGTLLGGLAGMGAGWMAGGPIGSAIGGVIGGALGGGLSSIAMNEALPEDF